MRVDGAGREGRNVVGVVVPAPEPAPPLGLVERPAVLREGGVERLADQLLDDPSPEPALKALCALAFEDVEVSLAISNVRGGQKYPP